LEPLLNVQVFCAEHFTTFMHSKCGCVLDDETSQVCEWDGKRHY